MGKSNKFDYTNRANSGAKLGHIIGSALQKEAEKVQKDAERHLQKARKQSNDGKTVAVDATTTTYVIDLKAPGKQLGDEGVCALLDGLEGALRSGTRQVSLVLVDLDLSGNCITTISLARLAPVIELAKHHLKALNLADNHIKVESTQQSTQWESFLRSFRGCSALRTLVLSDNCELGRRAMEVFARTYVVKQTQPDSLSPSDDSILTATADRDESSDNSPTIAAEALDMQDELTPPSTNGPLPKDQIGLPSIPYIILRNIGLDDAGAMWLSYILQDHLYANQLLAEPHATQGEVSSKPLQLDCEFRGIDWAENGMLGKEGGQLLEKAETLRKHKLSDQQDTAVDGGSSSIDEADTGARNKRKSIDDRHLKLPQEHRRASIRSIRTTESGEYEVDELESARKKVKRAIIAHDGATSVELWSSALKVVRVSRQLLYLAPSDRTIYAGPPLFRRADAVVSPASAENIVSSGLNESYFNELSWSPHRPTENPSYASKPTVPDSVAENVTQMLFDISNTQIRTTALDKKASRKGAFGEGNDLQTVNDKLNRLEFRNEDPFGFAKYQERRIAEALRYGRSFRDLEVPCQLPVDVTKYLLRFVVTGREADVMSEKQQVAALRWGQRRETLMREREWLRKDESAQVLMLLDSIDCLTYA